MLSMKKLLKVYNMTTRTAYINVHGLASDLALNELENNWSDSICIYNEDGDEDNVFTPEAKLLFDELYNQYCSVILSNETLK